MNRGKGFRLQICIRTDLPAHRHDPEIMELTRRLKHLIRERGNDYMRFHFAGVPKSAEHRQKIRDNHRGFTGQKHPEAVKEKIRAANLGKKKSAETRMKISAGQKALHQRRKPAVDPWAALLLGQR